MPPAPIPTPEASSLPCEKLLGLTRFTTTKGDGLRSLQQYVSDLRPNQTEIYYLVGDSIERLKANPKLEAARARGVAVARQQQGLSLQRLAHGLCQCRRLPVASGRTNEAQVLVTEAAVGLQTRIVLLQRLLDDGDDGAA